MRCHRGQSWRPGDGGGGASAAAELPGPQGRCRFLSGLMLAAAPQPGCPQVTKVEGVRGVINYSLAPETRTRKLALYRDSCFSELLLK